MNEEYSPESGDPAVDKETRTWAMILHLSMLSGLVVPLAGLIDVAAETARLGKEVERLEKELGRLEGKLRNENFVAKAPAELVEKEQAKLDVLKSEMGELESQFSRYFGD